MTANDLGEFLRARRASLTPEDLALPSAGRRRVPGLRREEVAVAAGVNVDYYTRLEQGRERTPSPQVVAALCRALLLGDDGGEHLYRLAGQAPPRPARPSWGAVSEESRRLVEGWTSTPALLVVPTMDVLAANLLAEAPYSPFRALDNLALMMFLDPAARSFYPRWERNAHNIIANLRHATGLAPENPRLLEVISTLTERSPEFVSLWDAHEVGRKTRGPKEFDHPDVGRLIMTYQALDVQEAPGQHLLVYHVEPDSPSAQALALLGSLASTRRRCSPAALRPDRSGRR